MNNKIILSMMLGIFLISFASASYCYQETPTISTSCGGLSSGGYDLKGTHLNYSLVFDGNWTTYGSFDDYSDYFIVYYRVPVSALNSSIWNMKRSPSVTYNISIPSFCYYNGYLKINMSYRASDPLFEGEESTSASCWNGSWYRLPLITAGLPDFYEESISWNINDSYVAPLSVTSSQSTFLDDPKYVWGLIFVAIILAVLGGKK